MGFDVGQAIRDVGKSIEKAANTTGNNLNRNIGRKVDQVTRPRKGTAAASVNVGGSYSSSTKFGEGSDKTAPPPLPPEYGKPKPSPIDKPYYQDGDPRKLGQDPYKPPPFSKESGIEQGQDFDPALEAMLTPRAPTPLTPGLVNSIPGLSLDYAHGYGYKTVSPFATTVNKLAYQKFKTDRGI